MENLNIISNYLNSFFKFLSFILDNSNNLKIIIQIIDIFEKITIIPGINQKIYLPFLIPVLIEKLDNERVIIRTKSSNLLRIIFRIYHKNKDFLKQFLLFLENDNWHRKEEILHIFCSFLLEFEYQQEILIENEEICFALLIKIASLLDDPVPKVN